MEQLNSVFLAKREILRRIGFRYQNQNAFETERSKKFKVFRPRE